MSDQQTGASSSSSEGRRRGCGAMGISNQVDAALPPVSPCGACKFLRRKCANGCIFSPYFTSDQGSARFAAVHKIFGASNVSKLLLQIPVNRRQEAVVTISYEAQARLADPVYGCVSTILVLQQQVESLQAELTTAQTQLMNRRYNALPNTTETPPPPQFPLGHMQTQHNQSLAATMSAMPQQQPAFATNSTSNNTNLINNFNNTSLDSMQVADTHNNGASASPLCYSHRQSLEDEDEQDAATFANDMFHHHR